MIENHTFDIVAKGNTVHTPMTDRTVEKPIGCKWIYKRKIIRMDPLGTKHNWSSRATNKKKASTTMKLTHQCPRWQHSD